MRYVVLSLAMVVAACTGSGADEVQSAQRVAFLGIDGNISIYEATTGLVTPITSDAGPSRLYSQPTWSPDGSRLAFVTSGASVSGPGVEPGRNVVRVGREAQNLGSAIHIVAADGGAPTIIPTPFAAFYLYWAPDGTKLAFLGNDLSILRQALGMIDIVDNSVERIDIGQPYFFAWSPDSDRLLVHAANSELYFLGLDGAKEPAGSTPGGFSAPSWVGDTRLFPVVDNDRQVLRLFDAAGAALRDATEYETSIALALNPDEARVAFIDIPPGANPFGLGPLIVDAPGGTTEVADLAAAFFWSPDGARLLYLTPGISGDDFQLQWNVWDGAGAVAFEPFLPTNTFFGQYLPFFGQYANSLSFFSPTGDSFTFAGTIEGRGSGIWLQPIEPDTPAELVAPGEFSTWAP